MCERERVRVRVRERESETEREGRCKLIGLTGQITFGQSDNRETIGRKMEWREGKERGRRERD